MKILAIGDPHGELKKVKKIPLKNIDLILLTGDLGSAKLMRKMAFRNVERKKRGFEEIDYTSKQYKAAFMEAYDSSLRVVKYLAKFAPVFIIFGNVESSNKSTRAESKEIGLKLPFITNSLKKISGVKIINNRLVNFDGVKIGGLKYFIDESWVKEFKPTDYSERLEHSRWESKKAKKILKNFSEVDVLVCHQPPYRVLDKVNAKFAPKNWRGKHAGSKVILEYIKKRKPKYVFCGHIHEGEGKAKIGKTEVYNLGVCGYKIIQLN
jgi:Icc-related predicted phosphoesterase